MDKRSTAQAVYAESLVFESNFGPAVGPAVEQGPEVVKRRGGFRHGVQPHWLQKISGWTIRRLRPACIERDRNRADLNEAACAASE